MTVTQPRIALIHATPLSLPPIAAAFSELWPEARTFNVLDDSLAPDKERADSAPELMFGRFVALARYAVSCGSDAILFTCSAFGDEIAAAREGYALPILKPNEAMVDTAVLGGVNIGVVATFGPTITTLGAELEARAQAAGRPIRCFAELADGAFAALAAGDEATHDRLVVAAAGRLPPVDVILLAQFSMARTRAAVSSARPDVPVLTSPHAAVDQLRRRLLPTVDGSSPGTQRSLRTG